VPLLAMVSIPTLSVPSTKMAFAYNVKTDLGSPEACWRCRSRDERVQVTTGDS
jgi:hypothetical protein